MTAKLYNIHWRTTTAEGQGYAPLTEQQANAIIRKAQEQDRRDGIEREYWIEPVEQPQTAAEG
jgi:hypothetical protein